MNIPSLIVNLLTVDLDGKEQSIPVIISFYQLHIFIRYNDEKTSNILADIRVSRGTTLISQSSDKCTISDGGQNYDLQFGNPNSLLTFFTYFNQTKQAYVREMNSFCNIWADGTGMTVPTPFLNVAIPFLYCLQAADIKQEIDNIHWFFVNLSPEDKKSYSPFLANLVRNLKTQPLVTSEMLRPLTEMQSSLTAALENVNPFSSADIELYFSNWVLLVSQGQGEVYRAVDNLTKEMVAIKKYKDCSDKLKNIKNEIRALSSLRNIPSIVHIRQAYCFDNTYYVVEELMQGMTLLDYVQTHGPMKEEEARIVMRILLETIRECHRRSIFHRDIKLDNIMFRTSENRLEDVVLLDFGLSIFAPADLAESYVGTQEYISPEILNRTPYSAKTDVWSLGVVFYGLVTGLFPFGSHMDRMLTKRIMSGEFTKNGSLNHLSRDCQDLISHLLEVDPMKRYSAEEALKHPWFASGNQSATSFIPTDLERTDSRLDRVTSCRSRRMVTPTNAIYIILRETVVHMTPEDKVPLFRVNPPLQVPVSSIYTNWERNEMWVQVQENMYYNNQWDRIEGKWILCQKGNHSPYAIDQKFRLYRGVENVELPVLHDPQSGRSYLVYPKNHYVIIRSVIPNGDCLYGEISDQSMLMFTSPQEKNVVLNHSNGYLKLEERGIPYLTRIY